MNTDGQGQGCRNGVLERPENDTFEFINVVQFDELELQIEVKEGRSVERIEINSNNETIHAVSNVKAGRQKMAFTVENATTFDITVLNDEGTVIDTAQFYSRCSTQADGGNGTVSS